MIWQNRIIKLQITAIFKCLTLSKHFTLREYQNHNSAVLFSCVS